MLNKSPHGTLVISSLGNVSSMQLSLLEDNSGQVSREPVDLTDLVRIRGHIGQNNERYEHGTYNVIHMFCSMTYSLRQVVNGNNEAKLSFLSKNAADARRSMTKQSG
jgi:hypothetical protein